ncbi:MAG: hypothetical protein KDK39_02950 [Leptospiraceae bacterium]|nr:hypothetical protein [Leptospiraceae bacterium]
MISLLCVLGLQCQSAPAWAKDACDPVARSSAACDGQASQILARPAKMVLQHPIVAPLGYQQSYWDTKLGQIIVMEKEGAPVQCSTSVRLFGTWQSRVGPCDASAQNRNQYCGMAITVKKFICL